MEDSLLSAGEHVSEDRNNDRKRKHETLSEKNTKKRAKVSREIEREPSPLPKIPCPICLGDLSKPDIKVEATPCAHVFCTDCLDRALKIKSVCPVCREPMEDLLHDFNDISEEDDENVF